MFKNILYFSVFTICLMASAVCSIAFLVDQSEREKTNLRNIVRIKNQQDKFLADFKYVQKQLDVLENKSIFFQLDIGEIKEKQTRIKQMIEQMKDKK